MSAARSKLPFKRVYSSGGVVFCRAGDNLQVIICGQRDTGVWALPKGSPRKGESLEETATREVREETGLEVAIVKKIGDIQYWFVEGGVRYFKTVHYYLMKPVGGNISDHDPEFDEVRWVTFPEALERLTYKNDSEIMRQAGEMVRSGDADGPV